MVLTDYVPLVDLDANFDSPSEDCKSVIDHLYHSGYKLIIAPSLFQYCIRWAHDRYVDLYFLLCGGVGVDFSAWPRISSSYNRDWEGRFAGGIVAGAASVRGRIGYIAPFPARISTEFAVASFLGARLANPGVNFFVKTVSGFDNITLQLQAAHELVEQFHCDVLVTARFCPFAAVSGF